MPLALKAKVELKWQTVPPKNTYYKVGELVWGGKTYFTVNLDKSVITFVTLLKWNLNGRKVFM